MTNKLFKSIAKDWEKVKLYGPNYSSNSSVGKKPKNRKAKIDLLIRSTTITNSKRLALIEEEIDLNIPTNNK